MRRVRRGALNDMIRNGKWGWNLNGNGIGPHPLHTPAARRRRELQIGKAIFCFGLFLIIKGFGLHLRQIGVYGELAFAGTGAPAISSAGLPLPLAAPAAADACVGVSGCDGT